MIFPSSLLIAASLATAALAAPSPNDYSQYQTDLTNTITSTGQLRVAFGNYDGTADSFNVSSYPCTHCVVALPANARIVGHNRRECKRGHLYLSFGIRLQCETIQLISQRLRSPNNFYQDLGALNPAGDQFVFNAVVEIASNIMATINIAMDNESNFNTWGVTAVRTTDPNSRDV
jgi:hypothetical protein